VTNSVSKSNALTGLRLGWILAPESFTEHAVKAHAWVTSCADTFAQQVSTHIFATPEGVREHAAWYVEQRAALLQALAASGGEFVELGAAIIFRPAPFSRNPALLFHAVKGGIKRPFLDGQNIVGPLLDALDNGVSMERAGIESLQNKKIESALKEFRFRVLHSLIDVLGEYRTFT